MCPEGRDMCGTKAYTVLKALKVCAEGDCERLEED